MCYFDRIDICEAYYLLESHYNIGGWVRERPSNQRRKMSTGVQLHRMGFKACASLEYETLSDNGRAIYDELEERYGFTPENGFID